MHGVTMKSNDKAVQLLLIQQITFYYVPTLIQCT